MAEISQDILLAKVKEKAFFSLSLSKITEYEFKIKFLRILKQYNCPEEYIETLTEELIEKGYIDDVGYVKAKMKGILMNDLSKKEIEYKLRKKGIDKQIIDDYFSKHKEIIDRQQIESIKNLYAKYIRTRTDEEVRELLSKKGFNSDYIKEIEV